jgi:hypothetical protein
MESISLFGRVAPIAKSPLDAARGRRRSPGMVHLNQEELADRLAELLREQLIQQNAPQGTRFQNK